MLVAVYLITLYDSSQLSSRFFSIDWLTASLAGAAGITASFAFALIRKPYERWILLAAYLLLVAATASLLLASGGLSSPYIALWMLLCVTAALFTMWGLLTVALVSHAYLAWLLISGQGMVNNQIITFTLGIELPLILGYFLWYEQRDPQGSSTYSALVRELGQVANKSEIVINAIADGVIAVDGKGLIQLINPAAQTIVGWGKQDASELDYRSVIKLVDKNGKEVQEANDPIQQCLKTGETVVNNSLSMLTTSGKTISVSLLVSPVGKLNQNGGGIIVFRDVTAARAEERQQAEFISTASHEMRTPVASIEGYLGLALNPATATIDDKARSYLIKAHESAQHLGRLFQDLLDISRAEDGRLKNEPTVIDLVHFSREISDSFHTLAADKQLELIFAPDKGASHNALQRITPAFYTNADADHLREVLSNLIENAIKYTKQGSVTVDVQGDDGHARVTVSDTGIGIPREDLPHLFQKFYRVDSTDTREIGGTGLGLYLSRRLVEAMGGRLNLESEYGHGSTFIIELPRLRHEDAMRMIEMTSQGK